MSLVPRGESKRCLVTGGAGFIGSHVARLLAEAGHEVAVVDDLSGGFRENLPESSRFYRMSVNESLDVIFDEFRPEFVYHLAAYAAEGLSHHIPVFNYANNVLGTVGVLAAAYRSGAKHFVFTSSIAVYGHPETPEPFDESTPPHPCDPYGIAKLACEQHLRAFREYYGGPDFTIFRPHNVFGPRQNIADPYRNVVGIFFRCAVEGKPMPVFGDGSQTRSFSYISTVAECIAAAPWTDAARGKIINVGGDEPMSVRRLAESVAAVMELPCRIHHLEARAEVQHAHCRHDLARRIFPQACDGSLDIAAGLRETARFVRNHPVPRPTDCPCAIEIADRLPPSWVRSSRADR
ncbi:MAG: NAD-dependent epimerase/dehydratase family protein [Thermoguttaceae bacterium]